MSPSNQRLIGAVVAGCACVAALGLSVACQQAKGDDVVTAPGSMLPLPTQEPPEDELSQMANDAGRNASVDNERPDELAPEPPTSDAGVQNALPADPLAVASTFPIAFRSDRSVEGTFELYVMHADGTQPERITRGGEFLLPRWSPDGARLVYRRVVTSTNTAEVGIVAANGAGVTTLTMGENFNLYDLPANWSLDGERILFGSVVVNDGLWAFSMAPSGGQRERLLPDVAAYQREVALSPADATRSAYVEADATGLSSALRVVDADNPGAGLDITTGRVARPLQPRWSPDGARIAFAGFALDPDGAIENLPGSTPSDAGGVHLPNLDLFLFELATGEVTRLTDEGFADDYEPAWSPDGTQLLFTSARDGDEDLWLMPVSDPSQAVNLIDDNLDRHSDGGGDWYGPPR